MKRKVLRSFAGLLALLVALGSSSALAAAQPPKDEVVYVNLATDGSVTGIYVVNAFDITAPGSYTDYGSYQSLRNLTTTQELAATGGGVSFEGQPGRFYYQGNADPATPLPWQIAVAYRLDGQPMEGQQLAGASGRLELSLDITKNPAAPPVFASNFALQISVTLDSESCTNLVAPDATLASVGKSRQLSYMLLPGKEGHYTFSADVTDFEMAGIQIAGVPLKLAFERPDTAEMKKLLADLREGVTELDDGANTLGDGASELYDGVADLRDGTADLREGAYSLYDGVREFNKGVQQATEGSAKLAAAIKGNDMAGQGQGLATGLNQLLPLVQGMIDAATAAGDSATAGQLTVLKQAVEGARDYAAGSAAIFAQVGTVADGMGRLSYGADDLQNGIRELYQGAIDLEDGVGLLYEGIASLRDGVDELTSGTGEFRTQSDDMDSRVDDEIDTLLEQYMGGGDPIPSFTDPRNNLQNLQFVLRTQDIKKPETPMETPSETPSPTLWQRVTSLFGS